MDLEILWFGIVVFFWSGYFLLEGFDFGVGMLLPFVPRNEQERSVLFRSIGPVWDGNETWLVVAGGATFAAFPAWYASMFSAFYIALLLVLFFLIIRVVSFEWRTKSTSPRWRRVWLWANSVGSYGAALIWGVKPEAVAYEGGTLRCRGDDTKRLTFKELAGQLHATGGTIVGRASVDPPGVPVVLHVGAEAGQELVGVEAVELAHAVLADPLVELLDA